jgi:hypothetical protein
MVSIVTDEIQDEEATADVAEKSVKKTRKAVKKVAAFEPCDECRSRGICALMKKCKKGAK